MKFYEEIETKRNSKEQMRIQTDLEFRQKEIQKLNQNYNALMFHTKIRGGKAFAAEKKIRELLTSKYFKRVKECISRLQPKELTQKTNSACN